MILFLSLAAQASSVPACPARSAADLSALLAAGGAVRTQAATCLVERHPDRALPAIEAWMADPAAADLATVVAERLDQMPEPLAVAAATAGIRGPHASIVTPAVWASERPMVRAVSALDVVE